MVKVPPWQCPSSAPAPPQGAPGGSKQLDTPRESPAHRASSHCLGRARVARADQCRERAAIERRAKPRRALTREISLGCIGTSEEAYAMTSWSVGCSCVCGCGCTCIKRTLGVRAGRRDL
eukprot:scaffold41749_cov75-Phaeocystis_antarctica.AAC.1